MVQKKDNNLKLVRAFKKILAGKSGTKIEQIILFGSRAKGTFSRYSDFDLMLISRDFEGVPWYKRAAKLYLFWKEDYPIELLCYTPGEIARKKDKLGIVSEALRTGIKV